MAMLSARTTENPVEQLAQDSRVARALDLLSKNPAWVTEQQVRITEIPAPEFGEGPRGEYVL